MWVDRTAGRPAWPDRASRLRTSSPSFRAGAGDQPIIEQWNGSSWSVAKGASAALPGGGYLSGVTCLTSSDCWAPGSTTNATGLPDGSLMEQWDGSSWSIVPTPDQPGADGTFLADVTCLDASRCWAAGSYGTFGGGGGFQPSPIIEAWNGSTWSIEPSPNVTAFRFLNSVTCVPGAACWAAGSSVTDVNGNDPGLRSLIEQMVLPAQSNQGLMMVASDGGVFSLR